MIGTFLFIMNTFKAIDLVKKELKWYENLEITLRSYRTYFLYNMFASMLIIYLAVYFYITQIIGEGMYQSVKYFGTLMNGMNYVNFTFTIMLTIYFALKIFEPDYRIEEIYLNNDLEEVDLEE